MARESPSAWGDLIPLLVPLVAIISVSNSMARCDVSEGLEMDMDSGK
jgi:hypothetical protein